MITIIIIIIVLEVVFVIGAVQVFDIGRETVGAVPLVDSPAAIGNVRVGHGPDILRLGDPIVKPRSSNPATIGATPRCALRTSPTFLEDVAELAPSLVREGRVARRLDEKVGHASIGVPADVVRLGDRVDELLIGDLGEMPGVADALK